MQCSNILENNSRILNFFKQKIIYEDEKTPADVIKGKEFQDNYEGFEKNKADVIRLIGYDPFEQEALSDQPFFILSNWVA